MRNTGISFYKKFCSYFPFKNNCVVWGQMQEGTPAAYHKIRAGILIKDLGGGRGPRDFAIILGVVRHLMIYWVKTYGEQLPSESETETPQT